MTSGRAAAAGLAIVAALLFFEALSAQERVRPPIRIRTGGSISTGINITTGVNIGTTIRTLTGVSVNTGIRIYTPNVPTVVNTGVSTGQGSGGYSDDPPPPPVPEPPPPKVLAVPALALCIEDAMESRECVRKVRRRLFATIKPLRRLRTEVKQILSAPKWNVFVWRERGNLESVDKDAKRADELLQQGMLEKARDLYASIQERVRDSSYVKEEFKRAIASAIKMTEGWIALEGNQQNEALERFEAALADDSSEAGKESRVGVLVGQAEAFIKKRWWDQALSKLHDAEDLARAGDNRSQVYLMIGLVLSHQRGYQGEEMLQYLHKAAGAAATPLYKAQAYIHLADAAAHQEPARGLSYLDRAMEACGGYLWDKGCTKEQKMEIEGLRRSWS